MSNGKVLKSNTNKEIKDIIVKKPPKKNWIKINLVDKNDNQAVSNKQYLIILPDGSEKEGKVDSNGFIEIKDIDYGECKITFISEIQSVKKGENLSSIAKKYGFSDWKRIYDCQNNKFKSKHPNPDIIYPCDEILIPHKEVVQKKCKTGTEHNLKIEIGWIKIKLFDKDDNQAVSNKQYLIILPDGSEKEGELDSNGFIDIRDIDSGECKVTFISKIHSVEEGKNLSSIAKRYGFSDWKRIYDCQKNKFKSEHPNPDLIYFGDEILIPHKEVVQKKCKTGMQHNLKIEIKLDPLEYLPTIRLDKEAYVHPIKYDFKVKFPPKPDNWNGLKSDNWDDNIEMNAEKWNLYKRPEDYKNKEKWDDNWNKFEVEKGNFKDYPPIVYYHVVTNKKDKNGRPYAVIECFYYYPLNQWNHWFLGIRQSHEHDWEWICVVLEKKNGAYKPVGATLSAHIEAGKSPGERLDKYYAWDKLNGKDSKHIKVRVERHGNAFSEDYKKADGIEISHSTFKKNAIDTIKIQENSSPVFWYGDPHNKKHWLGLSNSRQEKGKKGKDTKDISPGSSDGWDDNPYGKDFDIYKGK
jgi:hypothetical protein